MGRIFKQKHKGKPHRRWTVEYRDHTGRVRRKAAYGDKDASLQLLAELERDTERRKAGLVDHYAEHRKRPLTGHIDDWRQSIIDDGGTETYANLSAYRVRQTLAGIQATRWADIDVNRVKRYLAERRKGGLSIESTNHYTRRIKQFCRWMVKSRRAAENPVEALSTLNARTDRRHDRRAFATDELCCLISATHDGPVRRGVSGPVRSMTYRLSAETGMRANEIRTLVVGAFNLDPQRPTVTVRAAYSKHRRDDVLYLRPALAAVLRQHFANKLPTAPAFKMPEPSAVVRVLRMDLTDARAVWLGEAETPEDRHECEQSMFLVYRDDAGLVLDFHSFRHTFVSNLARGGVHPKVAQQLARHSSIVLTMDRYSHVLAEDEREALNVLPDLSPKPRRQRATGTADISPRSQGDLQGAKGGKPQVSRRIEDSRRRVNDWQDSPLDARRADPHGDPVNIGHPGNEWQVMATHDKTGVVLGALGLEPRTHGLKGRCSAD